MRAQGAFWLPVFETDFALLTRYSVQNQENPCFDFTYKRYRVLFFSKFLNGREECLIDLIRSNLCINPVLEHYLYQKVEGKCEFR